MWLVDKSFQKSDKYYKKHLKSTSITDENIEAVKKIILDNHRLTIREVADDVGISLGSC